MSLFVPEGRTVNRYLRNSLKVDDKHIKKIMKWLQPRDYEILRLLVQHPFLTVSQIEMMVFSDLKPSSWRIKANQRLNRLYHAHCIDRWFPPVTTNAGSSQQHIRIDRGGFFALAYHKGYTNHEEVKNKWHKRKYIPQTYRHSLKIYDFKALLYVLNRQLGVIDGGTVGEVVLWKTEHEQSFKFKMEENGKVKDMTLIPDGFCIYKYTARGDMKFFFLEVDNATMDIEEQIYPKINRYIAMYQSGVWREAKWAKLMPNVFPAVVIVMHDEESINQLLKFINKKQSNIRFLLTTYDKLITTNYKEYVSNGGKKKKVMEDVRVNVLEEIYVSNREGLKAL